MLNPNDLSNKILSNYESLLPSDLQDGFKELNEPLVRALVKAISFAICDEYKKDKQKEKK
jgi:hypothetical protein